MGGGSMITVVFASDDKFAEILGVALTSLYHHNDAIVYILDSGIQEANKKKLESIATQYQQKELQWIEAKDISQELGMEVAVDRGSLSQYARLFISSALPAKLERVIYLDCDVIIEQSLEDLWNLDMHGETIAALKDAFSKWYRMNIDLKPNDIMFNSGVMLIDLEKWKEKKVEERLLKFIERKNGRIQQGDQGALNAVLSKDVYCFEPQFNSVTIFYDFSYSEMMTYRKPPKGYYSEAEIKEATEHPVIIHFTTSFLSKRPWVEGCHHRYLEKWNKYKEISPFAENEKWKSRKVSGLRGVWIGISGRLPRKLMVAVSGVLQAFGRPVVNKIKK